MAGNKFRQVIEVVMKGAGKAASDSKKVQKGLQGVAKDAAKIAAAFYAAKGGINATNNFVNSGMRVQNLAPAFTALGSKIEMTSGALGKLKDATDGTINSMDLMQMANQAMTLGVVDSEDGMAKLFDTAQRLGKSLGVDTPSAINSLVTGMGRQSIMMLDNLGIIVDTEKAYVDYAESLGVSTSSLTDQQKKIAFNNAALEAAEEKVSALGDENLTASDQFARLSSATTDFGAALGERVLPILGTIAGKVADAVEGFAELIGMEIEPPKEEKESDFDLGQKRFLEIKDMNDAATQQAHIIDLLSNEWSRFGNNVDKSEVTMDDLQVIFDGNAKSLRSMVVEVDAAGKGLTASAMPDLSGFSDTQKMVVVSAAVLKTFANSIGLSTEAIDELGEVGQDSISNIAEGVPVFNTLIEGAHALGEHVEITKDAFEDQVQVTKDLKKEQEDLNILMMNFGIGENAILETATAYTQYADAMQLALDKQVEEEDWTQRLIEENRGLALSMGLVSDDQKTFEESQASYNETQLESVRLQKEQQELIDNFILMYPEQADAMGLVHSQVAKEVEIYEEYNEVLDEKAKKDKIDEDNKKKALALSRKQVDMAMALGAAQLNAGQAAQDAAGLFITAYLQRMMASYLAKAFEEGGFWVGLASVASSAVIGSLAAGAVKSLSKITFAAEGMNEVVTEPTLIMAGEEGAEYVNIEPTQNEGAGGGGGGQIIFQGNILSKDFIEDEAIPMIRDAVRRGHSLA